MQLIEEKRLIAVDSLSKTFAGNRALSDISLTLMAGEVHCLAGTNGCGKSTLIKVISGVHAPDSGSAITLELSLIHISEPTRPVCSSRMPSSA